MNMTSHNASAERPRYRLTKAAYFSAPIVALVNGRELEMGDVLLEPDSEVVFDGIPGPHMTPLNEAASTMCAQHSEAVVERSVIEELEVAPRTPDPPSPSATTRRKRAKRRKAKRGRKASRRATEAPASQPTDGGEQ